MIKWSFGVVNSSRGKYISLPSTVLCIVILSPTRAKWGPWRVRNTGRRFTWESGRLGIPREKKLVNIRGEGVSLRWYDGRGGEESWSCLGYLCTEFIAQPIIRFLRLFNKVFVSCELVLRCAFSKYWFFHIKHYNFPNLYHLLYLDIKHEI